MATLAFILPEVRTEISEYLTASDLAKLWICGNKRLQFALSEGGAARKFHLSPPQLLRLFWPSIACNFTKLASFQLSDLGCTKEMRIEGDRLLQLPTTLNNLKLHFSGSYACLQGAMAMNPLAFPNLVSLELVERANQPEVRLGDCKSKWPRSLISLWLTFGYSTIWDLNELPPCLENLRGWVSKIENPERGLPSTMRVLEVEATLDLLPAFVSFLPALNSLESVLLRSRSTWESQLRLETIELPPSVKSAHLPIGTWSKSLLESLPRNLERLYSTSFGSGEPENERNLLDLMPYWPPMLKDATPLTPTPITKEILQRMPKHIELLQAMLSPETLPYVPHLITNVTVHGEMHLLLEELKMLGLKKIPTPLKTLAFHAAIVPEDEEVGDSDSKNSDASADRVAALFAALPDTLTELNFNCPEISPQALLALPVHLTTLSAISSRALCRNAKDWALLPRSLTSLQMGASSDQILSNCSQLLPPTLEYLSIEVPRGSVLEKDWLLGLPAKSMRVLNIFGALLPNSQPDWSEALPPLLVNIRMEFSELPCGGFARLLKSLPRGMETCAFSMPKLDTGLVNADLAHLPKRALAYLTLPSSSGLTQDCTTLLPKTLRTFRVGILAKHALDRKPSKKPSSKIVFVPYILRND